MATTPTAETRPESTPLCDIDAHATLDSIVRAQTSHRPDSIAIRFNATSLTYQQLWDLSSIWMRALAAQGVRHHDLVGVCLPRTPDLVAVLIAVHRLGAAYVPLDPDYPAQRIAHIVADSRMRLVAASRTTVAVLADVPTVLAEDLCDSFSDAAMPGPSPTDLAYIIYTSGSTGLPKGVAIEHAQAVELVRWAATVYDGDEFSGVLFSTSICFDLSVFEIFATLGNGGTLVIADNALALPTLPDAAHVRLINTVPSAIGVLARAGEIPESVRTVNLAGEPLTRALTNSVYSAPGVTAVYNLYGPSEDTTYSTFTLVPRDSDDEPTIGEPLPGTRAYLVDDHGCAVADGDVGELYLAGTKVARGYLHRPDLTAQRFLPDPAVPGDRMYRTGDLAVRSADGQLHYRGRTDHQVKIRGFRVELGEIEATLVRHPSVALATVVVRPDALDNPSLVAFVESAAGPAIADDLRGLCQDRLPHYMVPSAIAVLETMPLTPNGKVDRSALPQIRLTNRGATASTPRQEQIADTWSQVLGLPERAPVDISFAALGGHSLLAAAVVHRLTRATGRALTLADLPMTATVRDLDACLEAARESGRAEPVATPDITGREYPALPVQAEFFIIEQLGPDAAVSVMPILLRTDVPVDVTVLQQALDTMVVRHSALRTSVQSDSNGVIGLVCDPYSVPLQRVTAEGELRDLATHPLPITEGRTLAAAVIEGPDDTTDTILIRVHHGSFDGWSIGLFIHDLAEVYDALHHGTPPPPQPSLPLADAATWLTARGRQDATATTDYWAARLAGRPAQAVLPPTKAGARQRRSDRPGAMIAVDIPLELERALASFSANAEVSSYSSIMAATAIRIQRATGLADMVLRTPVGNRLHPDLEDIIGPFLETAPVRIDVGSDPTFTEVVQTTSRLTAQDLAHSWFDTPAMFAPLGLQRAAGGEPLGSTLVAVQTYGKGRHRVGGRTWLAAEELSNGAAKTDLSFFWELTHATGPRLQVEFDTDLHTADGARRYAEELLLLLTDALTHPDVPISDLKYTRPEDVAGYDALNASGPLVASTTVAHAIASIDPTRAAVIDADGDATTYGQLLHAASTTAAAIRQATGGPGPEPVAVAAVRSARGIASMLAAWFAGRPYLPLDVTHPVARLNDILADSGAVALLHEDGVAGLHAPVQLPLARIGIADGVDPVALTGDDVAYVIYTSGSTGKPKGVTIDQRALASFIDAIGQVVPVADGDVVTYLTTPSFDIAALEMWLTLSRGATVAVVSEECARDGHAFAQRLVDVGATVVQATPSGWHVLLEAQMPIPAVRALVGAEPVPPALAARLLTVASTVHNVYGPTEATIWSCTHQIRPQDTTGVTVPIGRPLANTAAYVLDHGGHLAPVGTVGAIHLAGSSLAVGYHNRPELTEQSFTRGMHVPGRPRIYRTGDLGLLRPDGLLECLGRADNQVKVRGVRIELEEVDEALRTVPGVQRATSRVQQDGPFAGQLIGYLLGQVSPQAARDWLAQTLPTAMIPTQWVFLDDLPLNSSGKVDRQALPAPVAQQPATPAAPLSEMEEFLAEIWVTHLPTPPVSASSDFFELGGHSLIAARVVAQARAELELEIPVRMLFQHSRLGAFAQAVEQLLGAGTSR